MTARSLRRTMLGDSRAASLFPVQAFHSAAEAMFALSLVGSLFFNVSVDAARPRILLYLALTMAPFAVLAPLIGPFIDRRRNGHRAILVISLGGRAVAAVLLASQLKTLLLYPEAFVLVVLAKTYVVGRNALVPSLVERDHLVVVNSRLARVGAVAGLVGGLVGLAVLRLSDAPWVLRVAGAVYALGALTALKIPRPTGEVPASTFVEDTEMHGPGVRSATVAMVALRMATGLAVFHIGFTLKTSGAPVWEIASVGVAGAIGGFGGTYLAPILRARYDEQLMLTASLFIPSAVAGLASLRFHQVTAIAVGAALGLAGSVGRRAFDGVVQTEAPHARRGRAYAGLETRLELGWVVGALVAVLTRAPNWLGLVMLFVGLGSLAADRLVSQLSALRVQANTSTATLPFRLLETAEAVAARGDRQQAMLVAIAAVEAAADAGSIQATELAEFRRIGRCAATENDPDTETETLRLAHELLTRPA